jgi:NAD(P)-dependent dehydrogenase (short-subunit alcohol dehydrogenase family)
MTKPVAAVTGASRGIGLAIADILERDGYNVVRASTSIAPDVNRIVCDISDADSRQGLLDETLKRFGRVDLLVNNAGVAPEARLDILETTPQNFERLMRINLEGTFFMCQLFAKQMIKQAEGTAEPYARKSDNSLGASPRPSYRIINIASISSYTSSVSRGEYCISKAGISMVTKLFADRLAEYGIGVFEIRPGIILTDMTSAVKEKYERLINGGLTPVKRFGLPEDVAKAVSGIASGNFDFCTGQVFNVDGGFHLRRL